MNQNYEWNNVKMVDSIKELLELSKKEAGEKLAFEYKDEKNEGKIVKVTYNEFIKDTNELGTALAKYDIHDKHIAIIGENSYKWLTVYLAVLKSTGVFIPVDKELTIEGIINVLKHSESEVLFYSSRYEKWIDEITKKVPKIKYFIGLNNQENKDKKTLSYEKFKQIGADELENGILRTIDFPDISIFPQSALCGINSAAAFATCVTVLPERTEPERSVKNLKSS